jgi:hypothetical protein
MEHCWMMLLLLLLDWTAGSCLLGAVRSDCDLLQAFDENQSAPQRMTMTTWSAHTSGVAVPVVAASAALCSY